MPEEVALAARLHLLDACGVGLAAAGSPVGAAYRDFAQGRRARRAATVFGQAAGAAAADAALVNGGLIHSLEYDDTHTASIQHGSAVIAAAALAVGEARGASGAALLGAFARGWEVLIRFGLAAPARFHAHGFMSTSVGGALASALLASELLGSSEDQSVAALGISLSQASGVMEFLTNGSSVKSLHPGWAAHGGVVAALLARSGMTGPETSLEGRHGLFRQFAGDEEAPERFRALIGDIGRKWHLPDAAYKFYPCCHYLHPFVEAAGELAQRGVGADDAARILCRVPAGEAPIICDPWERKQAPGDRACRALEPADRRRRAPGGRQGRPRHVRVAGQRRGARARRTDPLGAVARCAVPRAIRGGDRLRDEERAGRKPCGSTTSTAIARGRPARSRILAKFRANAARSLPAGGDRVGRARGRGTGGRAGSRRLVPRAPAGQLTNLLTNAAAASPASRPMLVAVIRPEPDR